MRSEWEVVNVGDIYNTISETYSSNSSHVVLINTSDVSDGKVLNHSSVSNSNLKGQFKKTFRKDDILFSEIRPINRRNALVNFDATDYIASTKLMVLRAKTHEVLPEYMYRFLTSNSILLFLQSLAETRSGTFPQITFSEISSLHILLPPLPTQKAIADTLSCLDAKIELNNRINENLEQQAQAIFKSWFVDFDPFQDGEFVESELGLIPERWRIGALSDLMEVSSGKRPGERQATPSEEMTIPILGASKIMGYTNQILFEEPILVTGRVGTHGVVQKFYSGCWPSDNTLVMKTSYYEFVYQNLNRIDFAALNRGSTQPLITQADLKNQVVVIPEKHILKQFEEFIGFFSRLHCSFLSQNEILSSLRDTLLPRLMSGEIEVPVE